MPIVRPNNVYDEVVFIAHPNVETPTLASIQDVELAGVTSMLATQVGLECLKKRGIQPKAIQDRKSWLGVVKAVWSGEANFGLVYRDTFQGMSDTTRAMVNPFYSSEECLAFHSLLLNPDWAQHREALTQTLAQMHTSPQGQMILAELGIDRWFPLELEQMTPMRQLSN